MTAWPAVLERVAPSFVEVEVPDRQRQPYRLPGVVVSDGRVGAWAGLVHAAETHAACDTVAVRQGERSWTGCMRNYRRDWMTCAVDVGRSLDLPVAERRRSTTLALGEELALVGSEGGRPVLVTTARLTEGEPIEPPPRESYLRSKGWTAALASAVSVGGCLAFDAQARLAGICEPLDIPIAPIIPAEHLGAMGTAHFMRFLFDLGQHKQLIEEFAEALPTLTDPEPFYIAGLALEAHGKLDGAIETWRRSLAFDPLNPWPHRAIAEALEKLGRENKG